MNFVIVIFLLLGTTSSSDVATKGLITKDRCCTQIRESCFVRSSETYKTTSTISLECNQPSFCMQQYAGSNDKLTGFLRYCYKQIMRIPCPVVAPINDSVPIKSIYLPTTPSTTRPTTWQQAAKAITTPKPTVAIPPKYYVTPTTTQEAKQLSDSPRSVSSKVLIKGHICIKINYFIAICIGIFLGAIVLCLLVTLCCVVCPRRVKTKDAEKTKPVEYHVFSKPESVVNMGMEANYNRSYMEYDRHPGYPSAPLPSNYSNGLSHHGMSHGNGTTSTNNSTPTPPQEVFYVPDEVNQGKKIKSGKARTPVYQLPNGRYRRSVDRFDEFNIQTPQNEEAETKNVQNKTFLY